MRREKGEREQNHWRQRVQQLTCKSTAASGSHKRTQHLPTLLSSFFSNFQSQEHWDSMQDLDNVPHTTQTEVTWDGFSEELFHKEWVTSAVKLRHAVCAGCSNLPNRITSQTRTSKCISRGDHSQSRS